jgi:hypothetical protein
MCETHGATVRMDAATSLYALLGAAVVRVGVGAVWLYGGGLGAVLVGDKLYGYRGGLLARVEGVGWLPVVWVAPRLRQRVRAQSRLRALGRLERYGWALRERYRIEQVFGSAKRAYGSYLGCRGAECGARGCMGRWCGVAIVRGAGVGVVRGGLLALREPAGCVHACSKWQTPVVPPRSGGNHARGRFPLLAGGKPEEGR